MQILDFLPELREASGLLRNAGFPAEADELLDAVTSAYTTSSERLGDVGGAMLRIEKRLGSQLPEPVQVAFRGALAEIRKSWPNLRA